MYRPSTRFGQVALFVFHQASHPDFPATEPDDRVNGMAARVVHIAEVNPEKSEPLGSDAGG